MSFIASVSDIGSSPRNEYRWRISPIGDSSSRFIAQLGELPPQLRVLHRGVHHVLKLATLARAHAVHQGLHLGHLLLKLIDKLIHALSAGEHIAPLLHEPIKVRGAALSRLAQHLIQV